MLKKFVITPIIFFSGSLTAFAGGAFSVPPASFIHTHVSTVGELARQVTIDSIVCSHLANHFHVSNIEMVQYVHNNLKLATLKHAGYYRVACVRSDGSEYWVNSYLTTGTPVFASRATGQPVLKLACGNPMVTALPKAKAVSPFQGVLGQPQSAALPAEPSPEESQTAALLAPQLISVNSPVQLTTVPTSVIQPPVVLVASSLESIGSLVSSVGGGGRGFNFLPALAGVAGAVGVLHQGGSSSSPNIASPSVAPEASTIVSLGVMLALGGLAVIVNRSKKANQHV